MSYRSDALLGPVVVPRLMRVPGAKPPKTVAGGMTPEMVAEGRWTGVATLVERVKSEWSSFVR